MIFWTNLIPPEFSWIVIDSPELSCTYNLPILIIHLLNSPESSEILLNSRELLKPLQYFLNKRCSNMKLLMSDLADKNYGILVWHPVI